MFTVVIQFRRLLETHDSPGGGLGEFSGLLVFFVVFFFFNFWPIFLHVPCLTSFLLLIRMAGF